MVFCIFNDDGFESEYTRFLIKHLIFQGNTVYSFLPKYNQSGVSNSISIFREIKIEEKSDMRYVINGTPADCVIFAMSFLKANDIKIDLSLVGINEGLNIGQAKKYSGTISAALESVSYNVPTLAISSAVAHYRCNYSRLFDVLDKVILYVCKHCDSNNIIGLNLNFLNFNSQKIIAEHKCVDYDNKLYEIIKSSNSFKIVLSKRVNKLPQDVFLLLDTLTPLKEFKVEKLIYYLEGN